MLQFFFIAALLLAPPPGDEAPRPGLKIIQITDTHVGRHPPQEDGARLAAFIRQLAAQEGPVDLWAFTGDLTHKGLDPQFEAFKDALRALPREARTVLVKGNHDEGRREVKGEAWERNLGDPTRSVKFKGYRIVTAPQLTDKGEDGEWLMKTLRRATRPVLLFVHYYPRSQWIDPLRGSRLLGIFSGHWHGNQAVKSNGIYSFNTASSTLGGWDFSPPVARVIEILDGEMKSRLVPAAPRESALAWAVDGRILLQVVTATGIGDEVRCTVGGEDLSFRRRGLYVWESDHGLTQGDAMDCASGAWSAAAVPLHDGETDGVRWARPLGRMQYTGGPTLAGDAVIVATRTGLDQDNGGAVHALDLATGATRWTRDLAGHPAGHPAVDENRVYVSTLDGTLHALDLKTGEPAWTFRLADGFEPMFVTHWVGTGPALHDGRLYTCYQKGPYVVDAQTGALLDQEKPIAGYDVLGVSPALVSHGHLFCGALTEGLFSWTIDQDGLLDAAWKDTTVGVTASPAPFPDGTLLVRTREDLRRYEMSTGKSTRVSRLSWLQVPSGPLALSDGVVVTTGRKGRAAALRGDGSVVWTRSLGAPLATFELNRFNHPGPAGSPVSTSDGIAVASPDGVLRVLDPTRGVVRRSWPLGAPLASTPATAEGLVVVTDLGGTTWCIAATWKTSK